MKFSLVILSLLLLLSFSKIQFITAASYPSLNGLQANQFCNIVEKECVGKYTDNDNKYKVVCDFGKCSQFSHLSFDCGNKEGRCAMNKTACDSLQKIEDFIGSILFKTSIHGSFLSSKVDLINRLFTKGLIKLKSKIKNCPIIKYNWKAEDACVSSSYCFKKRKFHTNFIGLKLFSGYTLIKKDCPCRKSHSFKCGTDFCTINKKACDSMTLKKINKSKVSLFGIKNCTESLYLID